MKKFLILFVIILFNTISSAQDGWQILKSTKDLYSVAFSNASVVWAVGDGGIIKKSTDGGNSWEFIEDFPFPNRFVKVFFVSSQTGWILNDNGRNLKTTNGGSSWFEQFSFIEGTNNRVTAGRDLFFASDSIGWIAQWLGKIYKTTNGGNRWFEIQTPVTSQINSIYFISETKGWCAGDLGEILTTSDGGLTWTTQSSGTAENLNSIYFINNNTGFAVGNNKTILKTTNGGASWSLFSASIESHFNDIIGINSNTFIAAGRTISPAKGLIYKTTNGGNTWESFVDDNSVEYLGLEFIDADKIIAVGNRDAISITSNGGSTWQLKSFWFSGFRKIYFISSQIGFLIGINGRIMKTIDGGVNWTEKSSGTNSTLTDINFTNGSTGYISGFNKTLLKTTDGGENWSSLAENIEVNISAINSIAFRPNSLSGVIVGNTGKILTTTNGGNTWVERISGTSVNLNAVKNISFNYLAVGDSGIILKSTDAGATWEIKESGYSNKLMSIGTATTSIIFVGGEQRMLESTNGGEEWTNQLIPNFTSSLTRVYSIDFPTSANGWAANYFSGLAYTDNGGTTFNLTPHPYSSFIPMSVDFVSPSIGWVLDSNGHIIKTTDGGNKTISPAEYSIREIQETPNGQQGNSIYNGRYVKTSGVVTALYTEYFGETGINWGFFIQDGVDKWSGIFIDRSSSNVSKGDFVEIIGDIYDNDYTTIRSVDSINVVSTDTDLPEPLKLSSGESFHEAYEGVLVQVTGICDDDSVNREEWSLNDGSGSVKISRSSVDFIPEVGKTYTVTGPVFQGYSYNDLAILVCDSSDITEHVPNSAPEINSLPDTLFIVADSSVILNMWEFVNDTETPDSLLNYSFTVSSDSLQINFDTLSGELYISVINNFYGSGFIYINVSDDSSAIANDSVFVLVKVLTDADHLSFLPKEFKLNQNYPNPFNPSTIIKYEIPQEVHVTIKIYDILGKEVAVLVNEEKQAGFYQINFNANGLASGVYIYRIEAGSFSGIKKMVLIK